MSQKEPYASLAFHFGKGFREGALLCFLLVNCPVVIQGGDTKPDSACLKLERFLTALVQEAHINGLACVIACSQETAEKYCEGLRNNGLISSLEPDS